jgi:hypothetical protein
MKKKIGMLFILALCTGCASQKFTRRYAQLDDPAPINPEVTKGIEVIATARDVPQPTVAANKYVLTDHGQAAYIQAIAAKAGNIDDIQGNLFPDVSGLDKGPSSIDNTIFTKRLLLTVLNRSSYEADRITKLTVKIKLNTNITGLKILTFDKITTEYQTVDLGTINQANAFSATASASYGLTGPTGSTAGGTTSNTTTSPDGSSVVTTTPVTTTSTTGPTLGASLGATYSNTTTEQVDLKNRYVALTGYIDGDYLVFEEESVSGVNLTGNIISDIKFEFSGKESTNAYSVSNLEKAGAPISSDKIKVKVVPVFETTLVGALQLPVEYSFTVRHIINEKGQRTISEADDEIGYYKDKKNVATNMTLVSNKELSVKKWEIGDGVNALNIGDKISGITGVMYFTSYDSCLSFYKWLKKSVADPHTDFSKGDYDYSPSNGKLTDFIKTAKVVLVKNPQ